MGSPAGPTRRWPCPGAAGPPVAKVDPSERLLGGGEGDGGGHRGDRGRAGRGRARPRSLSRSAISSGSVAVGATGRRRAAARRPGRCPACPRLRPVRSASTPRKPIRAGSPVSVDGGGGATGRRSSAATRRLGSSTVWRPASRRGRRRSRCRSRRRSWRPVAAASAVGRGVGVGARSQSGQADQGAERAGVAEREVGCAPSACDVDRDVEPARRRARPRPSSRRAPRSGSTTSCTVRGIERAVSSLAVGGEGDLDVGLAVGALDLDHAGRAPRRARRRAASADRAAVLERPRRRRSAVPRPGAVVAWQ